MANNDILTEDDVRKIINDLLAVESAAREAQNAQEIINRQAGDDLLGQLITQETEERQAALSALQTATNQSITRIDGNVTQLQSLFNQRYDASTTLISNLNANFDAKVALLDNLRQTVLNNQSNITVLQGDSSTVGSVAKALFDAKAYTDAKVSAVLDGAPQILDTLKELATAVGNDGNFFTNINNSLTAEASARNAGDLNTLNSAKAYADAKKLELLNTLSQDLIRRVFIVLSQEDISNGYVVLPHTNIVIGSMNAFMNRIPIFEDEDFELTVVGQSTRLVFLNSLAIGGAEAAQADEQLRLTYWSLG